jgi:hypothetical protein
MRIQSMILEEECHPVVGILKRQSAITSRLAAT